MNNGWWKEKTHGVTWKSSKFGWIIPTLKERRLEFPLYHVALLQQYEDINTQTPPPINAFTCPYLSIHPHIVWVYECMSCMYPCVHVFVSLILPICSIFVLYLYFTTLINYSPFDYSLWLHLWWLWNYWFHHPHPFFVCN